MDIRVYIYKLNNNLLAPVGHHIFSVDRVSIEKTIAYAYKRYAPVHSNTWNAIIERPPLKKYSLQEGAQL